jgi:hypothetical protein
LYITVTDKIDAPRFAEALVLKLVLKEAVFPESIV